MEEINAAGGVLGKKIVLVKRDSMSRVDTTRQNVYIMIAEGVTMIFGGASSAVAAMSSQICQEKGMLFMGTVTASNDITDENAHRHTFRACYNAWMGAKALGEYLKTKFSGKKYFYITAGYSWGISCEDSLRKFTGTTDTNVHQSVRTPFPASDENFASAIVLAKKANPDVLVMVQFGGDMSKMIRMATEAGLKEKCQFVVPVLELNLAIGAGPKVMEGVYGGSDWNWRVPYKYNYERGIKFVEKFVKRYNQYPCWGASTAYTNLYEYKSAVERAKSFDVAKVIKALEGHTFTLLKDAETWRDFDHQCIQFVFVVQCKKEADVLKDPLQQDYFNVLQKYPAADLAKTRAEWDATRASANKPPKLEPLEGE